MAFAYCMTAPGAENVERRDIDVAPPGPGEVQLDLQASTLNYHDLVTLMGFIPNIDYPRVPLSDGCGVITAIGEGVSGFAVGDSAITLFHPLWRSGRPSRANKRLILGENIDGCLQEKLNISAAAVVKAPTHLNPIQAASLVCAGHTAWYGLMEEHALAADHTVLVQGTGGVSLFALQIAKAIGATVVATSSSDAKLEQLRALGADHTVNYTTHTDWEQEVLRLTGGVDVTMDIGGEATLGRTIACTNTDGFIAVIGILTGFGSAEMPVIDVMQKNLTIKGITVGCGDSLARFSEFVSQHTIEPIVSHELTAAQLSEGLALMQGGKHFGKIGFTVE
ncbi:MAG: NAD(P)-dependent alcohol dehydrogenase [Halioglobus sp.]